MKKKINEYVKYMMNVNNIKDNEMFIEITNNLHDRYDSFIKEGMKEDDAYLKTINTLGDFDFKEEEIDNKYKYKPNWANISLMVSHGLAILGTIALLIHTGVSLVFTGVSLSLYIGSAYYSYHLSKYVLNEEKDVAKHNSLLKNIFTNLKTSFIFWNINISFWLTSIILKLLTFLGANPNWMLDLSFDDIGLLLIFLVVLFIIIFTIIYLIFNSIYKKLEQKYLDITNEEKLESYLSQSDLFGNYLKGDFFKNLGSFLYFTIYSVIILLVGFKVHLRTGSYGGTEIINAVESVALIVILIPFIFIFITTFFKPIKNIYKLMILISVDIITSLILYFEIKSYYKGMPITRINIEYHPLRFIVFVINVIILLLLLRKDIKHKKTE